MHGSSATVPAASFIVLGCGGSYPVPTQSLADAQSVKRSPR